MDFSADMARNNPALHIRLFHGAICNLKCKYCFTNAPSTLDNNTMETIRKSDNYSSELLTYREKLEVLAAMRRNFGTRTVLINGRGESTLEPDFRYLIRGINSLKMRPVIVSNGTTFVQNWEFLYENNASVMLKMNSLDNLAEADIFGITTQSKRFKNIRTALDPNSEWFRAFASERRLGINCVISRDTVKNDDHLNILKFCRENGAIPWFDRLILTGRANHSMALTDNEYENEISRLIELDKAYGIHHRFSQYMNFGCTPEMNTYFFQLTNHGRMFITPHLGDRINECDRRISGQCFKCPSLNICIHFNVLDKLAEYGKTVNIKSK
jgi:MoaA/NifB/PqqE/SkfB family radical SAM enzyme